MILIHRRSVYRNIPFDSHQTGTVRVGKNVFQIGVGLILLFRASAVVIHRIEVAAGGVHGEPGHELVACTAVANALGHAPRFAPVVRMHHINFATCTRALIAPTHINAVVKRAALVRVAHCNRHAVGAAKSRVTLGPSGLLLGNYFGLPAVAAQAFGKVDAVVQRPREVHIAAGIKGWNDAFGRAVVVFESRNLVGIR